MLFLNVFANVSKFVKLRQRFEVAYVFVLYSCHIFVEN